MRAAAELLRALAGSWVEPLPLAARCTIEGIGTGALLLGATLAAVLPERLLVSGELSGLAVPAVCSCLLLVQSVFAFRLSGAHFNPALSLAAALTNDCEIREAALYTAAQIAGAFAGVILGQFLLNVDMVQAPAPASSLPGQTAAACLDAFLFVLIVRAAKAWRPEAPTYGSVAAACFLTISVMSGGVTFGNPAMTLARTLTTNALSLSPQQAAAALAAELAGAILAALMLRRMTPLIWRLPFRR